MQYVSSVILLFFEEYAPYMISVSDACFYVYCHGGLLDGKLMLFGNAFSSMTCAMLIITMNEMVVALRWPYGDQNTTLCAWVCFKHSMRQVYN